MPYIGCRKLISPLAGQRRMIMLTFEEFIAQVRANMDSDLIDYCCDVSRESRSIYSPDRIFYYVWVDNVYVCYDSIVATPWHVECHTGVFGCGFSLREAIEAEAENYQAMLEEAENRIED